MAEEGDTKKPSFDGVWKNTYNDNIEAFLEKMGVPWLGRKGASKASATLTIKQEGDEFKIQTKTLVFSQNNDFTIDKEIESEIRGKKVMVKGWWEGNTLVTENKPMVTDMRPSKVERNVVEVEDGGNKFMEIHQTMTCEGVVCKRIFRKQP